MFPSLSRYVGNKAPNPGVRQNIEKSILVRNHMIGNKGLPPENENRSIESAAILHDRRQKKDLFLKVGSEIK
jgi:hypothetical protein